MPASMISAPTGSMPKVIGKSMVMVAIGPTPGSTPIKVPIRQPRKQSQRFLRVSATARPSERLEMRSKVTSSSSARDSAFQRREQSGEPILGPDVGLQQRTGDQAQRIEGNRQVQKLLEQKTRKQRQRHGKDGDFRRPRFIGTQ